MSTGFNGELYTCETQWIASPNNLPEVDKVGTFGASGDAREGTVKLTKLFKGIPNVLTHITSFDIGSAASHRLRVMANSRLSNSSSVSWKVESWGDSSKYVYNVRGSFLAFPPYGSEAAA